MNWHFITFASGDGFTKSGNRLLSEAKNSKLFRSCNLINEFQLKGDFDFWNLYGNFIQDSRHARGYGYWLWKPRIILNALKDIPPGDGLLYLDAGSHLNLNNRKALNRMSEYFQLALSQGSLAFEVNGSAKEFLFTHPQILHDMGVPKIHRDSPQIEAATVFLINSSENHDFVRSWFSWMVRDDFRYLCAQDFQIDNQTCQGRHDQSIMSCLFKLSEMVSLPNETYFHPRWSHHGRNFPIWNMRHRSGNRIQKNWISIQLTHYLNHSLDFIQNRFGRF